MKDVRTPDTYFHQRGMNPESIARLKGKLDDLLESLYEYRERYTNMLIAEEDSEQEIIKQNANDTRKHRLRMRSRLLMLQPMELQRILPMQLGKQLI